MTGLNFQVLRICAEVESEIIGIKLQPVAEMLRHSDGKQAFLLQIAASHTFVRYKTHPLHPLHSKLFFQAF